MSKTREQFPLSKKKIIKKTISATISWLFLLVFCGPVFLLVMGGIALVNSVGTSGLVIVLVILLLLLVVIVVGNYWYQTWYYATYFYDFTNDYVIIRKSPLTPKEITIPYERIQDVYVDQDLIDRMMGLYDVHLSTATISSGMNAHIDGVESAAADGLRAFLLKKVQERVGRNAMPVSNNLVK
jgi:membrane protein YdbS with pleckstrin-like domain